MTIGTSVTTTLSSTQLIEGKGFGLGDRYVAHDGKEYVYVQASGAITGDGYVCIIDETYQAAMVSTSNDDYGDLIGVARTAFADNDYGWLQVKGPGLIRVAASCAANADIGPTATAGVLDDAAGALVINGIALTTANGGSEATAAGILNYPVQTAVAAA